MQRDNNVYSSTLSVLEKVLRLTDCKLEVYTRLTLDLRKLQQNNLKVGNGE